MFSIGGSTGIILSTNVMDIALHDSYYVVSHFHMVLSLGAINSIFSGISTLHDLLLTVSISNNTRIYLISHIVPSYKLTILISHNIGLLSLPIVVSLILSMLCFIRIAWSAL
jgi:heme/copper-type cytochrome/quinol oxidase subunit 1